jgi:hypothetical protein
LGATSCGNINSITGPVRDPPRTSGSIFFHGKHRNKKRKQIERDIQDNLDAFRNIQNDIKILEQFYDYKQYYNDTKTEIESNNQYLNNNINILLKLLKTII